MMPLIYKNAMLISLKSEESKIIEPFIFTHLNKNHKNGCLPHSDDHFESLLKMFEITW